MSILLAQCKKHNHEFSTLDRIGIMLNDYAVTHKYPTKEDTVTEQDMNAALDNAHKILNVGEDVITETAIQLIVQGRNNRIAHAGLCLGLQPILLCCRRCVRY